VFAGLRATCESVASTGHGATFDVFVLSDSNDPAVARAEREAWEELRSALAQNSLQPQVQVYYRLRTRRTHRKAGNVADFCRRWGQDYRYMVVLDADSVMSGDCIVSMAKLMEANPTAGIIQTAGQVPCPFGGFARNSTLPYFQLEMPSVRILPEVYSCVFLG
jgi:membrane glycosyltransferase